MRNLETRNEDQDPVLDLKYDKKLKIGDRELEIGKEDHKNENKDIVLEKKINDTILQIKEREKKFNEGELWLDFKVSNLIKNNPELLEYKKNIQKAYNQYDNAEISYDKNENKITITHKYWKDCLYKSLWWYNMRYDQAANNGQESKNIEDLLKKVEETYENSSQKVEDNNKIPYITIGNEERVYNGNNDLRSYEKEDENLHEIQKILDENSFYVREWADPLTLIYTRKTSEWDISFAINRDNARVSFFVKNPSKELIEKYNLSPFRNKKEGIAYWNPETLSSKKWWGFGIFYMVGPVWEKKSSAYLYIRDIIKHINTLK